MNVAALNKDRETLSSQNKTLCRDKPQFARKLIETARQREIDSVLVWRLDRWGRSLVDLVSTLQELTALDVGFVSLKRSARSHHSKRGVPLAGKPHGRPMTAGGLMPEMKQLRKDGISKRAMAQQLGVSRTPVIRWLRSGKRS